MIKVILFDLGGVLFTNGTKQFIEYLHQTHGLDTEKVRVLVDSGEIPDAYREGRIGRDEFWTKVKEELGLGEDIHALEQKWIEGYELIEGTRNIILKLSNSYGVYFLSDNVKDRVEAIDQKFHFLSWFSGGVFSHEVGVRKPNPKIYEVAIKKVNAQPEEIIFIDDKQSVLSPAAAMGIQTILFESPAQLEDALKQYGIVLL